MQRVSRSQWREWAADYAVLPFAGVFPNIPFPAHWRDWWREGEAVYLLETGKQGRYTILATDPRAVWLGWEDGLQKRDSRGAATFAPGNTLEHLREELSTLRAPAVPGGPPFTGGVIGFFSYDLARLLERLPSLARRDLYLPLFALGLCMQCWVYDHETKDLYCCVNTPRAEAGEDLDAAWENARRRTEEMAGEWRRKAGAARDPLPAGAAPEVSGDPAEATFSQREYTRAVRRIQDWIAAGDTYQVNLSVRESRPLRVSPDAVYDRLRVINPSSHMALLRLPGFDLVSGSPELLVSLRGGQLATRPIAGTRPRGASGAADASLGGEMLASPKERAEHLMLVDLLRNDLGRVAAFGSVRVEEFMTVERYSHVMHIVSHVTGRLAEGRDAFSVIRAVFPGGTITGAPKVRTMEIIEELEPVRRGPYTGSIGWIGFHGDMELNITIRTLLAHQGMAHVQAGAGIVADSIPENEYQESLNKGKALWAAVAAAEALRPEPVA